MFFSTVDVLPTGPGRSIDFLAPGILALAVMSASMVSLAISTGFERSYGVLKRLGVTPLGRPKLVVAKIGAVVAVELVQFAVLVPLAFLLGWDPQDPSWLGAVAGVVLGTTAFAGLGLILAGRLRAEVNLAAANGLYLVLLLISGMMFSLDELPGPARAVARLLPSSALADVLRGVLSTDATPARAWIVLAVWAVATPVVAARVFRWE
ncbi:MAG: ABC transporter permease [Ilumatobacteraceae bacterium]